MMTTRTRTHEVYVRADPLRKPSMQASRALFVVHKAEKSLHIPHRSSALMTHVLLVVGKHGRKAYRHTSGFDAVGQTTAIFAQPFGACRRSKFVNISVVVRRGATPSLKQPIIDESRQ